MGKSSGSKNIVSSISSICTLLLMNLITANVNAQYPQLEWARTVSPVFDTVGHETLRVKAFTFDADGNSYITGYFNGNTDFDPGAGVTLSYFGFPSANDLFVLKLDSSGNFVWAKTLSTFTFGKEIQGTDIVFDGENILVTGHFNKDMDFDPGPGVFTINIGLISSPQTFILKLNQNGDFIFAKKLGSPSSGVVPSSFAIDKSKNIYTTGVFSDIADLDPGPGIYNIYPTLGICTYICKLDSNGNFVYAKSIGSSAVSSPTITPQKIVCDHADNVFITGFFHGTADLDPGSGVINFSSLNNSDAFILKLDSQGNYLWNRSFNLNNFDQAKAYGMATDISDNLYVTGLFTSAFGDSIDLDPTNGIYKVSSDDGGYFVLKLDGAGNFIWARNMGGVSDYGEEIAIDNLNNVYVIGATQAEVADFDPSTSVFNIYTSIDVITYPFDIFVHKLDGNGNFGWARAIEAPYNEIAGDIDFNHDAVYTCGHFGSYLSTSSIWNIPDTIDADPTAGYYPVASQNWYDLFVFKWSQSSTYNPAGIGHVISDDNTILAFPNPNAGNFYLNNSKPVSVTIYDALGKQQFSKAIVNPHELISSKLKSGLYSVVVLEDSKQRVVKIMVN